MTHAVIVSGSSPGSVLTSETRLMSTVIERGNLQPPSPAEEAEEDHAADDQAADANAEERRGGVDVLDHPSKVLSEEAGHKGQRQEDRGDDGELLHHVVDAVGDAREVDVHGAGEDVAVGVDLLGDPRQVVPDVAEVVA